MKARHWALIVASYLFVMAAFVIGQYWQDQRLKDDSGTIPPLEIERTHE